jgi:putative transposase
MLYRKYAMAVNHKKIHRIVKKNGWQRYKRPYGNRPGVACRTSKCLTSIIDCCDRTIVGWNFSCSSKAGGAAGALENALIKHQIVKEHGLVICSDNGLVFSSKRFQETISKYCLTQEYITPYTPEQNGMIERFFRSFKEECAWQYNFQSFDEAYNKIADWIDHYNNGRPHSALNYKIPAEVRYNLVA